MTFDKTGAKLNQAIESIFKLSTGALALSITFRGSLVSSNASFIWLLSLSWLFLGLCPIVYVFLRIMESSIEFFWEDKFARLERGEPAKPMQEVPQKLKRLMKASDACYKTMLLSFVAGILTFLFFAVINNHTSN